MARGYTNDQMAKMIDALQPLLDRCDIIGYAAARNTRILSNECAEYLTRRSVVIEKYGEPELDGSGNPTGRVVMRLDSPNIDAYNADIEEWARIEHYPEIFRIPFESAIGNISGTQLLAVDFMFEDGDA